MQPVNHSINTRRATDNKPATLLCIDDEPDNLKLLATIFNEQYKIIACKSAAQGFQLAIDQKPDLILLDVIMPNQSGFELIKKLKSTSALRHIPVIFITGLNSTNDEEKGLTLGACDYIQKPFSNSIVKARVNTHLEIVRQRKLLEQYANIDPLTEIANRRKWEHDAYAIWSKSLESQSALVIGIIDIDHFKRFNDCYGHIAGDSVLRKVAHTLKRTLHHCRGRIFRCGGEEFYFYIPVSKLLDTQMALCDCLQSITNLKIPHQQAKSSPYLSISIGAIKVTPNHQIALTEAVNAADDLLYQVKDKTRNAVQYLEVSCNKQIRKTAQQQNL